MPLLRHESLGFRVRKDFRDSAVRNRVRHLVAPLALAAVYITAGKLGLMIGPVHTFATLVWAPTGISLAALLLGGNGLWPGVALGALIVNVLAGAPILVALGIAVGNTAEALAGAYLVRRLAGFQGSLDGLRSVLGLIALGSLLSTTLSATIGVGSLLVGGQIARGDIIESWRAWWVGDAVGDLIVASLVLAWYNARPRTPPTPRLGEAAALVAAVTGATLLIFARSPASEASRFIEACLLIPLLTWGGLRFGMKGATTTVFLASVIAVWGTALGRGPFVVEALPQSLLFLQCFMAVTATAMLVLGGVIADRERLYEAEQASRHRAESAERTTKQLAETQERLVAMVGHDLRNPLAAITAGIAIFRKRRKDRLEQWEDYTLARQASSAERMNEIIENVLAFAKAKRGESIPLRPEPTNMGDVCRKVIAEAEQAYPQRVISLCVDGDDRGEWDAARIAQVVSNLVGNAIQHSPAGALVEVHIKGSTRSLVVQVHNSGPHIPPEVVPNLFEPFRSGPESAGSAHMNVGLGLYIVREIVRAHGGTVDVCSRAGHGTSFAVKLPRCQPTGTTRATPH